MKIYIKLFLIFFLTAVLSFINQIIYALYFGASSDFDMINAILSLPYSTIGIGTGAISLIIMPILNEAKEKHGECSSTLLKMMKLYYKYILLLCIIIVIIEVFIFYDKININQKIQFIKLSFLSSIFLFISIMNSFFIVFFNFNGNYILASINSMVVYIFSIVLCYIFSGDIGVDIIIYSLIMSNIILFILFFCNFNLNFKKTSKSSIVKLKVKKIIFLAGIFSTFPFTLPIFIDSYFLLSLSPGSLSYISYANKIIIMITTILIQPLNIIIFPRILSSITSNNLKYIRSMLLYIYTFVFIGLVGVYIISKILFIDFMKIFFENGSFSSYDTKMVYQVFLVYLIGAFGMISMNIQNKVLSSFKMFKVQIISSLIFIIIYSGIVNSLYENFGYMSSGYAYALCWCINSIFIAIIINKNIKLCI